MSGGDPEACTSKFPRRLARDIYLSMDVGRTTAFDPFSSQDMTTIFAEKKPASRGLSYFAPKPLRKTKGAYVFSKMPHAHNQRGLERAVCDASYSPTLPASVRNVYFPRATRFPAEGAAVGTARACSSSSSSRRQAPLPPGLISVGAGASAGVAAASAPPTLAAADQPSACGAGPTTASVRREARRAVSAQLTHAPTLGPRTGPTLPPRHVPKTSTMAIHFPWERRARQRGQKGDPAGDSGGGGSGAATAPGAPQSPAVEPPTDGSGRAAIGGNGAGAAEEWNAEHRALMGRLGLVASGGRRDRAHRRAQPRGADFARGTGRTAPTPWLPREKEIGENPYRPRYDATTAERKRCADVRIDRCAARASGEAPHVATANRVLSFGHILRYHHEQRRRERESPLARPDAPRDDAAHPMSAADDFALHPTSVHPPATSLTRKFPGAPDLGLYGDRPDLPLSAHLGVDPKKYYRAARMELAAEEAALQREEEEQRQQELAALGF